MKYNFKIYNNGVNSNVIIINGIIYITSYESIIAEVNLVMPWENCGDIIILKKNYNYSKTTSKHLNQGLKLLGVDVDKFKKDLEKGLIKIEG